MASQDQAIGFGEGFANERDRLRRTNIEDQRLQDEQSELAHARQRRAITEGQQDAAYAQSQEELPLRKRALETQVSSGEESLASVRRKNQNEIEDRPVLTKVRDLELKSAQGQVADAEDARARKHKEFLTQAESEGVKSLADSLDAGIDARTAESRFNTQGTWKIKPGTLNYDPVSKKVAFQGAGGQQFNGTLPQMRTLFGGGSGKAALIKGDRDTVFYDDKGNPVGAAAAGGNGLRKQSPFNRETVQQDAAKHVEDAYKNSWNTEAKAFTFSDVNDTERASKGRAYAQLVVDDFLKDNIEVPAAVAGDIALKASRHVVSPAEAEKKATDELTKAGRKPSENQKWVQDRAAQIVRVGNNLAGQELANGKREYQRQLNAQDKSNSKDGNRPPLSSFQQSE
jgi:hypothetical protein